MKAEKKVNLTYYPSLNSPYTFVSAKRVKEFQDQYPINLITRPVLPMLMRMMVIPAFKGKYIISDAAREGRKYGYEMKEIFSPIGKPARKAYSLFPVVDSMGKGFEYIDELLKASFQEGINIGDDDYLMNTVTELGLDWNSVKKDLNTSKWKKVLNDNVNDMYQGNCWGVPSFKITDADGSNPYYVWGQDRMWLLKEEINRRLT
jgi:2-hydroxychromene-2-carboxylate isomerase